MRLIAYTSINHFGFIILGIFVMTSQSQSGSTLHVVNHGISTAADCSSSPVSSSVAAAPGDRRLRRCSEGGADTLPHLPRGGLAALSLRAGSVHQ